MKITPKSLQSYFSKTHIPNNMELILTGRLPDNIDQMVNHYFGQLKRGNPIPSKQRKRNRDF